MKIRIRKNGAESRPWRATCSVCSHRSTDRLHFSKNRGVVVVNNVFSPIGNRTWELAMLAAQLHIQEHRKDLML